MASDKSSILSGFIEDCEQLIFRFEQANDIRFETFCEIWKEMRFPLVFTGRPSFLELLEFCEESLNVCKQFLLLPSRFKRRIGGLYLLYGIYYKMPIEQFKIRMKLDDWRSLMEFHAEIKEAEHLDANYILCKLIIDNAFHFCIFDQEFGLEKHYRTKNTQWFNPYSVLSTLKDLTEKQQILSQIDELSKQYEHKKQTLISQNNSDTGLKLFNANIAKELVGDIQALEDKRQKEQVKNENCKEQSYPSTSKEHKKLFQLKGTVKKKGRSFIDGGFQSDSNTEDETLNLDDFDSNSEKNLN